MTNLTPEQRALGRENANRAFGTTRRDFLRAAAGDVKPIPLSRPGLSERE